MKKNFSIFIGILICQSLSAQWSVDKGHSRVGFTVSHHGISEIDGSFKKYEALLSSSKEDLSDAVFDVTVEVGSIDTDLEMRDGHLKGEDIFNAEKYPTMTFKSTGLKKKKKNKYVMDGLLTLRGVTKPIKLDVTLNGPVDNPNPRNANRQIGIKAVGTIKRSDFNLGSKLITAFVADEVQLRITGEFNKPK